LNEYHINQTRSEAHPATYQQDHGAISSEVKPPGREAYGSPLSNIELKNIRGYNSIPPYLFVA
jgi:hypothetical protein